MKSKSALYLLLALVGGALALFSMFRAPDEGGVFRPVSVDRSDSSAVQDHLVSTTRDEEGAVRREVSKETQVVDEGLKERTPNSSTPLLTATVVDMRTGLSLSACFEVKGGRFNTTRPGSVSRQLPSFISEGGGVEALVTSPGYDPARVTGSASSAGGVDFGTVKLMPSSRVVVEVVGINSEPLVGCDLLLLSNRRTGGGLSQSPLGVTDDDGLCEVGMLPEEQILARHHDGRTAKPTTAGPGAGRLRITCGFLTQQIRLRDQDTREPVSGMRVSVTSKGRAQDFSWQGATGNGGGVGAVLEPGEYRIEAISRDRRILDPASGDANWALVVTISTCEEEGEVVWLDTKDLTAAFAIARDMATGEVIQSGESQLVRVVEGNVSSTGVMVEPQFIQIGKQTLDAGRFSFAEMLEDSSGELRLRLECSGYEPYLVTYNDPVLYSADAREVLLERRRAISLRLTERGGQPVQVPIWVFSDTGALLGGGVPDTSGLVTGVARPRDWIKVCSEPHVDSVLVRVSTEGVGAGGTADCVVEPLGKVIINFASANLEPNSGLMLASDSRALFSPAIDGGRLVFSHVPGGRYMLGTPPQRRHAKSIALQRPDEAYPIRLRPGQTLEIEPDVSWSGTGDGFMIEGTVNISGVDGAVVVPLFQSQGLSVQITNSSKSYELGVGGSYAFWSEYWVPNLAVGTLAETGVFVPLSVFPVSAQNPSVRGVKVQFRLAEELGAPTFIQLQPKVEGLGVSGQVVKLVEPGAGTSFGYLCPGTHTAAVLGQKMHEVVVGERAVQTWAVGEDGTFSEQ